MPNNDELLREHQAAQRALSAAVNEVDQRRAGPLVPAAAQPNKRFDRVAWAAHMRDRKRAKKNS